jgi:hypothetical protein
MSRTGLLGKYLRSSQPNRRDNAEQEKQNRHPSGRVRMPAIQVMVRTKGGLPRLFLLGSRMAVTYDGTANQVQTRSVTRSPDPRALAV